MITTISAAFPAKFFQIREYRDVNPEHRNRNRDFCDFRRISRKLRPGPDQRHGLRFVPRRRRAERHRGRPPPRHVVSGPRWRCHCLSLEHQTDPYPGKLSYPSPRVKVPHKLSGSAMLSHLSEYTSPSLSPPTVLDDHLKHIFMESHFFNGFL